MNDLKTLVRQCESNGFAISTTAKGRLAFRAPTGQLVIGPSTTPGDHRALKNLRALLVRAGLPKRR